MPMYQWKCKKCNQVVTVMRSVVDIDVFPYEEEEILPCSEKDEENVDIPLLEKDIGDVRYDTHQKDIEDVRYWHQWERLISRTSFHLTGNGWFNKGGY